MLRRVLSTLLLLAAFSLPGWTQVLTGRIQGTVTDPLNAVIPGADVKVVNKDTGQSFDVVSNELGTWALPSMSTGEYVVTISLPGF